MLLEVLVDNGPKLVPPEAVGKPPLKPNPVAVTTPSIIVFPLTSATNTPPIPVVPFHASVVKNPEPLTVKELYLGTRTTCVLPADE